MDWLKIALNRNQIEGSTPKALLLKMPNKSDYEGFIFWIPAKLVHFAKNDWDCIASFTPDFAFIVKKYGKGKYNSQQVLDEKKLTGKQMFSVWDERHLSVKE